MLRVGLFNLATLAGLENPESENEGVDPKQNGLAARGIKIALHVLILFRSLQKSNAVRKISLRYLGHTQAGNGAFPHVG
jgi:hypothetical protein